METPDCVGQVFFIGGNLYGDKLLLISGTLCEIAA